MDKDNSSAASTASPTPSPAPAPAQPDNSIRVEGILDIDNSRNGALLDLAKHGKRRPTDPFMPRELIRRFHLNQGSMITAMATPDERFPNPKIRFIEKVDGLDLEARRRAVDFANLTTITPDEQIKLELKDGRMTTRVMDLFCPIGKGTRGLIVAPPRTGKTTLPPRHRAGRPPEPSRVPRHDPPRGRTPRGSHRFQAQRPRRGLGLVQRRPGREPHPCADLCIERAKRLVEAGKDVVLLIDSLTRLARAHNTAKNSGRTGSGGLDVRALEKPRQLFASARNTEDGGSLTIIASILVETGSRMDDVIFQEFKGTGNMELVLDRKAAEMRIWPAVNIQSSGTRKEELLISDPKTLEGIHFFRRALVQQKIEEATDTMVTRLGKTKTNAEFIKLIVK
jgi:transcription termination factor Rho